MITRHNPETVPPAFSNYALASEAPAAARWVHVSGQVGMTTAGQLCEGFEAQCEQAFRNILAILESAGMGPGDIVKVTVFLTRQEDTPHYRAVRDRVLQGHQAASTLLVISGLAHPDWLVEIEAVAARA